MLALRRDPFARVRIVFVTMKGRLAKRKIGKRCQPTAACRRPFYIPNELAMPQELVSMGFDAFGKVNHKASTAYEDARECKNLLQ